MTTPAAEPRYRVLSQLDHLQAKYTGTGHTETTKWEWVTHQHRDSIASFAGVLLREVAMRLAFSFVLKCL